MPKFSTHRVVRHSPEQMFDLVADVEKYPEFLPLCERLSVRSRAEDADGSIRIVALMGVGYGLVHETFTTEVVLRRDARQIVVRYLEGPFRKLHNDWTFHPHVNGCEVAFFIDYEFRSLPLQLLMGAMFDKAFRKFAEAFEARADRIYGDRVA